MTIKKKIVNAKWCRLSHKFLITKSILFSIISRNFADKKIYFESVKKFGYNIFLFILKKIYSLDIFFYFFLNLDFFITNHSFHKIIANAIVLTNRNKNKLITLLHFFTRLVLSQN